METDSVIAALASSEEPAVRLRASRLAGRRPDPGLAEEIRQSPRATALVGARAANGHAYHKWYGSHWVLVSLAEIGYPAGDESLLALRDHVYDNWLSDRFRRSFACASASALRNRTGVPVIEGRARRCASQQGNALYATVALGIADERAHDLVRLLLGWQWPDGGWNCDKNPGADTSSFHETVSPLRGLAAYAKWKGADPSLRGPAQEAAARAAEVFLTRRLFRRRSDGTVMDPRFLEPAWPRYWHYDLVFGLLALKEAGLLHDPRCAEALDELRRLRLPDGGWPAPRKHYRAAGPDAADGATGASPVSWGPHGLKRSNPWVTLDALEILAAARTPPGTPRP